ncbi:HD-GYP domain-containing protein [Ornithinimicrobium sp. Y1847]
MTPRTRGLRGQHPTAGAGPAAVLPEVLIWVYIAALALAAGGAALMTWRAGGDGARVDLLVVGVLTVLGTLGVILRERGLGQHLGISLATVVLAAALPLAGTVGAVVVGFVSYACDVRQPRLRPRAFNAAMAAFVGAVGAMTYAQLGGLRLDVAAPVGTRLLIEVGLPMIGAYIAMTLVNVLAFGVMSALVRGTRVITVSLQVLRSLGMGYAGHIAIAFGFAVLWGPAELGPLSAVLVLGPLVAAHWSIGREAMARREHEQTVATFVEALEQAEPASVGHSARVAELAELLAQHLGVSGRALQDLRYAALVHDIGLVAVRGELPTEPQADEVGYLSAVSAHPEAGVAILDGLDFLAGARPAIAHHHERWDGRGYPAGLAGEEIPLAARVIAVADAYDALVGGRDEVPLGPDAALAVLQERAGGHLDPQVVQALVDVRGRLGGAPDPSAITGLPEAVPAGSHGPTLGSARRLDHDHPRVSDAFAEWQPDTVMRQS